MDTNNLSCGHELRDGRLIREVQHICLFLTVIAAVNTHLNSWKARDVRELRDQAVNISRERFLRDTCDVNPQTVAREQSRVVVNFV